MKAITNQPVVATFTVQNGWPLKTGLTVLTLRLLSGGRGLDRAKFDSVHVSFQRGRKVQDSDDADSDYDPGGAKKRKRRAAKVPAKASPNEQKNIKCYSLDDCDIVEKNDHHTTIAVTLEGRLLQIEYLNNSDIEEMDPNKYIQVGTIDNRVL